MKKLIPITGMVCACLYAFVAKAQVTNAPSYPLLSHNPYFNLWCNSDNLPTATTVHWSGVKQPIYGSIKVDDTTYNFMGQLSYAATYTSIIPTVNEGTYTAKYTTTSPSGNWQADSYDDSGWTTTTNPPFTSYTQNAGTTWSTPDIWVRRKFNLSSTSFKNLYLKISNDDEADFYINGTLIYVAQYFNHDYAYIPIPNNLLTGENIITVHCHNYSGSSFLDFGLAQQVQAAPTITNVKTAVQKSVVVTATQTTYTFTCGKVNLAVDFITPKLMDDLALISRPVSYISYKVNSTDGAQHDVKAYFGATPTLITSSVQVMAGSKYKTQGMSILKLGNAYQNPLSSTDNEINWGYLYVSAGNAANATQFFSPGKPNVSPFFATDTAATSINNSDVLLNTIVPFGKVGATPVEKVIEIGEDDIYTIKYFGQNLQPWFKGVAGSNIENELAQADANYSSIMKRCNSFDAGLYTDAVKAGGAQYAAICALVYRQTVAASELTQSPQGDLIYAQNEISSGGFVNTVDVVFPASPMFIMYGPKLLEGMLNGEYYYVENTNKWTAAFAPHDIGGYPIADGNHYLAAMPTEETGNMILMTAAICKAENSIDYARKHWTQLTKWANYLNGIGYNPGSELTSDDFNGVIAHSLNLSAKLINAVAAYAGMARAMGDEASYNKFGLSAKNMAAQWVANGASGDHSLLAFDQPGTWSQKYNIVWDKLLNMNLFPQSVYDNDTKYYLAHMNPYGVPLDSRKTITKSDWSSWTASVASTQDDFAALIAPIYKLSQNHPDRGPFTDYYETTNGSIQSGFRARPVQGGFFMKLLMRKWSLDSICSVPTNLSTTNITATSATLSWTPNSSAEGFSFQAKLASDTEWKTYTIPYPISSYNVTGLTPNTTYQWRIASICQFIPQVTGAYSDIQTASTKAAPAPAMAVKLTPNPAYDVTTVSLKNTKGVSSIKLLDLNGNILWKADNTTNTSVAVPLSKLRNGIYIIGVENNGQVKRVKFIKNPN